MLIIEQKKWIVNVKKLVLKVFHLSQKFKSVNFWKNMTNEIKIIKIIPSKYSFFYNQTKNVIKFISRVQNLL